MELIAIGIGIPVSYAFLAWGVKEIGRIRRGAKMLARLESAIQHRSVEGPLLTPAEIAEFHAQRWSGD